MRTDRLKHIILAIAVPTAFTACTLVDLCPETEHPHTSYVNAKFDWSGEEADKPAEMNIFAARKPNTWRINGKVNTETGEITTTELQEGNTETEVPMRLRGGEYTLMAINNYEDVTIDNLDVFLTDTRADPDTLFLRLNDMPREELPELRGIDLPDFNPSYRYVRNIGRVYYDLQQDIHIDADKDIVLHFAPEPISQTVTIHFNIRTIGNVQIDSLVAEISGIGGRLNIAKAYIDTTKLYRIVFRPTLEQIEPGVLRCSSRIQALGIIPSLNSSFTSGPGILQVAIYASAGGRKQIFHAGANPREDLINARLTERRDDGLTYLRQTEPVEIFLSEELVIDEKSIVDQGDESLNYWFDHDTNIDVDV